MPWSIYSPEDFPKLQDEGYMADYRQAYGVQVILKANQWNDLEELGYKHEYYQNWVDMRGDAKEIFISSAQVADRICRDCGRLFGQRWLSVGLMACNTDKTKPEVMKQMEAKSQEMNLEYRKKVVEAFELEFRSKTQGGPGRYIPNQYEADCYKVLGIPVPEVVSRPKEVVPQQPQIIMVQPDSAMIADLVAKEMAKLQKPVKVI